MAEQVTEEEPREVKKLTTKSKTKHPIGRTLVTLALAAGLFNVGQDLVRGEGNPLFDMIGTEDFSFHPHLSLPSIKSLMPPDDPEHPRNLRANIALVLGSPRDLLRNAVNSMPHISNLPIQEQARIPEVRNEWGYTIWGRPTNPNFVRETLGHVLQFGGIALVFRARAGVSSEPQSKPSKPSATESEVEDTTSKEEDA